MALAEELHFSRAAERLFIAQQALSKQIRELEEAIGTPLLVRTTRKASLTPAGEAFLSAARAALAAFDDGVEAARGASRGETGTLKLGFMIGAALELTEPLLATFRERHPAIQLDLREFGPADPSAGLADEWADAALVRVPLSITNIEFEALFTEPLVFAVQRAHPLAGRAGVSVHEILDEPIAVGRSPDPAWERYWRLDDYRDGTPAPVILPTGSHTEELELIAAGVACMPTSAAAARWTPHPGVRFIPIDDVPGSTLGVAWRRDRHSPLVEFFVAVARDVRERERAIIDAIEHPFAHQAGA